MVIRIAFTELLNFELVLILSNSSITNIACLDVISHSSSLFDLCIVDLTGGNGEAEPQLSERERAKGPEEA